MPRIAIAQIRPSKGEYAANLQKIGGVLAQIAKLDPPVDLVIFPETVTSGYFVEGGVRDVAVTAGTLFRDLTVDEVRSEEHTSELQSRLHLVCRLLLEKKKQSTVSYYMT